MGDLNYRVTLPNDNVRQLVTQNDFKTLLSHDQVGVDLTPSDFWSDVVK